LAALELEEDRLECECRALTETVRKLEKERDEALKVVASWKKQSDGNKSDARKFKNELSEMACEKILLADELKVAQRELKVAHRDFEEKRVEAKEYKTKLSESVAEKLVLQDELNVYKEQQRKLR
jgi:chromosome segregation ATPase